MFLGGAALTRAYVEQDLREVFAGEVRYARDAFEGLRLMDALMAVKRGEEGAALPAPRERRVKARGVDLVEDRVETELPRRSDVAVDIDVPTPPFWGDRIVKGIALADVAALSRRAGHLHGPVGPEEAPGTGRRTRSWSRPRAGRGCGLAGPDPDRRDRGVRRRLRLLAVLQRGQRSRRAPSRIRCRRPGSGAAPVHLPAADAGDGTCAWRTSSAIASWRALKGPDVVAFHLVTMGSQVAKVTASLFEHNAYRDYLELHGLSVQLTEALAELWHARVRADFGFARDDGPMDEMIRDQAYRGSRYSFGYPACPELEDRRKLVALLRPERIGVELSEELQLHPEQSTDAMIVHHPEAKYFNARLDQSTTDRFARLAAAGRMAAP